MTMNVTRAYENLDRRHYRDKKPKPGFRSRIPASAMSVEVRNDGHPVLFYMHPTKGRRQRLLPIPPKQETPAVPTLAPEIVS